MLADTLRSGFALAHRRIGLVVLDTLWKVIWAALSAAVLFLVAWWMTSGLRSIAWENTGVPGLNGLIAAALVREFWRAHQAAILLGVGFVLCFSVCAWFVLEALFRRKLVASAFHILLVSNASKSVLLGATTLVLIPVALAGAVTIAIVTFVALAFFVTLVDTLVRADAVDLLGTDLFRVAGLLGILLSFESMVAASVGAILVVGFLNVSGSVDAVAILGAAVVAVILLSLLHSYLLLVRFSAIAIMRQNVVDV